MAALHVALTAVLMTGALLVPRAAAAQPEAPGLPDRIDELEARQQAEVAAQQEAARARVQAEDRRERAVAVLSRVDGALATGSTDVGADLAGAVGLLDGIAEGPARRAVEGAREALGDSDLSLARVRVEEALRFLGVP